MSARTVSLLDNNNRKLFECFNQDLLKNLHCANKQSQITYQLNATGIVNSSKFVNLKQMKITFILLHCFFHKGSCCQELSGRGEQSCKGCRLWSVKTCDV